MNRTLLILDGTERFQEAFSEAQRLLEPQDKLTILGISETPQSQITGTEPGPSAIEYVGMAGGPTPDAGPDRPVFESEDETERRAAGNLRDELDDLMHTAGEPKTQTWTQAIVRDRPAYAVAAYIKSSGIDRIAIPASSAPRLAYLLADRRENVLDGTLAPLVELPA